MRKTIILTSLLFLIFLLCWKLFYDKEVTLCLLPVAPPAYVWLAVMGGDIFAFIPLFLYACILVALFSWSPPRHPGLYRVFLVAILSTVHIFLYQITLRNLRDMGRGIVEQGLGVGNPQTQNGSQ